jgi:hypothetical protein
MKYDKPELVVLFKAIDAVKASNAKPHCVLDHSGSSTQSDGCGYESDE